MSDNRACMAAEYFHDLPKLVGVSESVADERALHDHVHAAKPKTIPNLAATHGWLDYTLPFPPNFLCCQYDRLS